MIQRRDPRPHPYLFFSSDDLPALRQRRERGAHDLCYRMLLQTSERLVAEPIPEQPDSYCRAYATGCALQCYGQTLAFAYALTGEERYAAVARDWALRFAAWTGWSALPDPLPSAHFLLGASLIYDWLGDFWKPEEGPELRRAIADRVRDVRRLWEGKAALDPSASSTWVSLAAVGLGGLALLAEEGEARRWAEGAAELFAERVLPASFGRGGEFMAGVGWEDLYALRHGLLFFDALLDCEGPDLFADAGLRSYPNFLRQFPHILDPGRVEEGRPWGPFRPPSPFHYRYVLRRLAASTRQGGAAPELGDGDLAIPADAPLEWFYRILRRAPYEAGRWYTVSLSWDMSRSVWSLGVDRQHWSFHFAEWRPDGVEGVRFASAGAGLRLRHLGVRAGGDVPRVFFEQEVELRVGTRSSSPGGGTVLQVPELRLDFPAAAEGMVWFQLCKEDVEEEGLCRLICGEGEGPGLLLTAAGPFRDQGGEFLRVAADGGTAPPDGWSGGQIWFDGPWEYLWSPIEEERESVPPPTSQHFPDADLAFLRTAEEEVALEFRGGSGDIALRVGREALIEAVPQVADGADGGAAVRSGLERCFPHRFAANLPGEEVDERGSARGGVDGAGIEYFSTSEALDLVVGRSDCRGLLRRVAYIKPDCFVLLDDIAGVGSGELEWRLHTAVGVEIGEGGCSLIGEDGGVGLSLLRPEGAAIGVEEIPALCRGGSASRLSVALSGDQNRVLALFVPFSRGSRPSFRPEVLEGRGGMGVRLVRGGTTDLLLFRNPQAEGMSAEGVRSAARLFFVRRSGRSAPSLYGVVDGTQLQVRTELIRTSRAADVTVRRSASRLGASVRTETDTELRLAVSGPPRTLRLNGDPLAGDAYSYVGQGRRLVLELSAGSHEIEASFR